MFDTLTLRPATAADLGAVTRLVMAQNLADYGEPMLTAEGVRAVWAGLNLARDTVLALTPAGQIVGYAQVVYDPPARYGVSIYMAEGLTPEPAQALGAQLLAQVEGAVAVATASHPNTELIFHTRVSGRNMGLQGVLAQAGYARRMTFLIMDIVLHAPPPAPQWPPGIEVRPFVVGQDEQVTYLADEEASADKGYHAPMTFEAWASRMNLYAPNFEPQWWFLAWAGGEVAGVALNSYSRATKTGWVDHLGVRPPWRKQGLGLALLQHAFGAFYAQGIDHLRLSVDALSLTGAPRLYERAGMRVAQEYHIYRKTVQLTKHSGNG